MFVLSSLVASVSLFYIRNIECDTPKYDTYIVYLFVLFNI